MEKTSKITSFTDLIVWKEGHELVIQLYKLTHSFPPRETYSLTDQIRRSSISITSNIAEGFGRHGYKEKIQFYYLAQGSLTELKNQLLIARDVGYIDKELFISIAYQTNKVHKILIGLIQKTKYLSKIQNLESKI